MSWKRSNNLRRRLREVVMQAREREQETYVREREIPELLVIEYFEGSRTAILKELGPMSVSETSKCSASSTYSSQLGSARPARGEDEHFGSNLRVHLQVVIFWMGQSETNILAAMPAGLGLGAVGADESKDCYALPALARGESLGKRCQLGLIHRGLSTVLNGVRFRDASCFRANCQSNN